MDFFIPSLFTEYHLSEIDIHTPTNEELVAKIAANNNFLLDLIPIGTVIFFNNNQSQGASLDSQVWQICDGSEITNPLSPIRSLGIYNNFTPDLRNKYPRGANDQIANNSGGSFNHNILHSHGTGVAGGGGAGMDEDSKGDVDQRHAVPHTHGIPNAFANPTVIEAPKYVYLNAYMKVA